MLLKIVGFLVMTPSLLAFFLGAGGQALILFTIGALCYYLGSRTAGREPCPHCAEPVLKAAKVCPHCKRDIAR